MAVLISLITLLLMTPAAIYYSLKLHSLLKLKNVLNKDIKSQPTHSRESQNCNDGFRRPFPTLVFAILLQGGGLLIFLFISLLYHQCRIVPQKIPFISEPIVLTKFWACICITPWCVMLIPLLITTIIDVHHLFERNNIHHLGFKLIEKYLPAKQKDFTYMHRVKFILVMGCLSSLLAWLPYVSGLPSLFDTELTANAIFEFGELKKEGESLVAKIKSNKIDQTSIDEEFNKLKQKKEELKRKYRKLNLPE